jgi:hypothetical protein
MVFPFLELLNSASAMLSLSFDRTILVPARPALLELQATVGAEWVHVYEGELSAEALRAAMCGTAAITPDRQPQLSGFEWSHIAAATLHAYRTLTARNSPVCALGAR